MIWEKTEIIHFPQIIFGPLHTSQQQGLSSCQKQLLVEFPLIFDSPENAILQLLSCFALCTALITLCCSSPRALTSRHAAVASRSHSAHRGGADE